MSTASIRFKIAKMVKDAYSPRRTDSDFQMYVEDVQTVQPIFYGHDAITALMDIFVNKRLAELLDMAGALAEMEGKTFSTEDEALAFMMKEMDISLDDLTDGALTYHCYEPWDAIIDFAIERGQTKNRAVLEKTVAYLYDQYSTEEWEPTVDSWEEA